jgi:hypothetical protein
MYSAMRRPTPRMQDGSPLRACGRPASRAPGLTRCLHHRVLISSRIVAFSRWAALRNVPARHIGWSGELSVSLVEAVPENTRPRRARLPPLLAGGLRRPDWLMLFLFGRFSAARSLARAVAARRRPPAQTAGSRRGSSLAAVDDAAVIASLRKDGICTGLRLPEATVAEIRAYADTHVCYGGPDWNTPIEPWDHETSERRHGARLLAGNFPDCDSACPAIAKLILNPWLHDIAAGYFGARPELIDLRLWWSFPAAGASRDELSRVAQDTFHFDLADWQQLKFFFYITDVDAETGAHIYARGSHAGRPLADQLSPFFSRPAAKVAALRGAEAIEVITGPAGTGFVEDPFGLHTGSAVRRGRRLILEVSFGISRTTRRRDYLRAA